MTHYMNQAAKDWLLRALEVIHQEFPAEAGNAEALQHALYEEIKALPVIDAGDDEAEAALDRLCDHVAFGEDERHDLAAVRAALRRPEVTDAEAGAALDVLLTVARTSPYAQTDNLEEFHARVSARLRAARSSHTPEELEDVILAVCWLAEERGLSRDPECRMALDRIGDFLRGLRPEPAAKPKETQG